VRDALARVEESTNRRPQGPSQKRRADRGILAAQRESAQHHDPRDGGATKRLQSDGLDPEGWLRLVRSYMVLGEPERARAAAGDARRALAGDPVKLRQFEDLVKALGS
jgi:cytochrome c-type biogenesis protein CcmH